MTFDFSFKMRNNFFWFLGAFLLMFSACSSEYKIPETDISKIKINYNPIRTEQLFFAKAQDANQVFEQLNAQHPLITDLYFNKLQ